MDEIVGYGTSHPSVPVNTSNISVIPASDICVSRNGRSCWFKSGYLNVVKSGGGKIRRHW